MRQTSHGKLHAGKNGTVLLFCLMLLFAAVSPAHTQPQQRMIPPALTTPGMPLLPYLDYFLDKSGEMDEKEVTSVENARAFRPFDPKNLPHETGAVWLRFILAPLSDGVSATVMFLDLGESVPGAPALKRKISPLPEAGKNAKTCLVRLDGMPGPWFQPMLRTPENVADNRETLARPAALVSLAVVMLLCILRCLTEKGQWRFWTAVYVGMALLQGFLGQPATGHGRIEAGDAAAALAPGMALLLLSHVGRHLTGARSRALNIQFFLLSLPGAALVLLPLLSDFNWITRYFDLWPLGTLLYVPSALGAVMMGVPRAGRFLLGCLLPPLFTATGLLLAGGDIPASLLASAPLWGIALSAMIIATISVPTAETTPQEKSSAAAGDVYNLEEPLGDPNLRIIPVQPAEEHAGAEAGPPDTRAAASPELPQILIEDAMRLPLEHLTLAGTALEHCALPPAARQYVANMLDAGREMADIISNPLRTLQTPSNKTRSIFNLQHLMRNAHDCVAPMAKASGIGLAWYMPPHLGHMYEGEAENLDQIVRLLLESAVRATRHGAVQFSAKRVPESTDAGHLLFTIKDTGSGMPPHYRSSLALTRVWELVGSNNGFLGMECSPQGTTVAFTLHLTCREDEVQENGQGASPHVIIVAESAVDRQLLSHMLKSLPCKSSETRSLHEALLLHKENPALLLVLHGRFADSPASLLQQFTDTTHTASPPSCKFLGITRDDSRWDAMAQEGFTHALTEPVDSESFCMTVREILDELPRKGTAAENGAKAPAAEPERTESAAGSQKSVAHADDATTHAPPDPASGHPDHSPSPLPDIFTADAMSGSVTQIKVPDLTALPDLLSFAESLHDSAKNSIDKNAQITPTDTFGGLFGSGPLHPLDMHFSDSKSADLQKTDNAASSTTPRTPSDPASTIALPVPEIPPFTESAVQTAAPILPTGVALSKAPVTGANTAAMTEAPPISASAPGTPADAASRIDPALKVQFSLQKEDLPAVPDDSAANADTPPVEQAAQEHRGLHSRLKHARRKMLPRKGHAAPQTPDQNLPGDPAGPQENETSLKKTPGSFSEPARVPDASQAARRTARTASDAPVEWVGEPVPIPSPKTPAAAPLRGRLEIRAIRKEKTETSSPKRSPQVSPAASGPARHEERLASDDVALVLSGIAAPSPVRRAKDDTPDRPFRPEAIPDPPSRARPHSSPAAPGPARHEERLASDDVALVLSGIAAPSPVRRAEGDAPDRPFRPEAIPDPSSEAKPQDMPFMDFIAGMARNPGNAPQRTNDQPVRAAGSPVEELTAKPQTRREADNTMRHLVERLDRAAADAQNAFTQHRAAAVGEASRRIAAESDDFGLRVLARMARCVERAARANDMNALKDLLPELMTAVERNRIALTPRE